MSWSEKLFTRFIGKENRIEMYCRATLQSSRPVAGSLFDGINGMSLNLKSIKVSSNKLKTQQKLTLWPENVTHGHWATQSAALLRLYYKWRSNKWVPSDSRQQLKGPPCSGTWAFDKHDNILCPQGTFCPRLSYWCFRVDAKCKKKKNRNRK